MVDIDIGLFKRVLDMGLIDREQFEIKVSKETRERAKLCIEKDFYGFS